MYTKLHVDHRYYHVWYFYEHLITRYACWIGIHRHISNGSLISWCLVALASVSLFCVYCGSWRFYGILWLSVAFSWFFVLFCVAFCGSVSLWLFV